MSDEENRLIRQAQAGDPGAFAEIYRRYQPKVYRYVYFRVDNEATAEDLTSEVFVRLVERIPGFHYRGRPLLAWLYTIARNLVIDHYRRRGRITEFPLDDSLVADGPDPSQTANRSFDRARLVRALDDLTDAQREVILLKFFEEMDNSATARVLGKTVGAVKALQHRGLSALARAFAGEREQPT
jgi:RNA polymerase sigma-70 factor, ECF subfamily